MKLALERLGFGPCHHMMEVIGDPEQQTMWRAIAAGDPGDWDTVFANYSASVDWPSAFFWRELSQHYPDAKILLTVRDADSWYASMEKTILPVLRNSTDPTSVGFALIGRRVFGGRLDDREHIIATYERNNAEVQAAFPSERVLTYHLGDGWGPLCAFLGVAVPDEPYPRTNSAEEFQRRAQSR